MSRAHREAEAIDHILGASRGVRSRGVMYRGSEHYRRRGCRSTWSSLRPGVYMLRSIQRGVMGCGVVLSRARRGAEAIDHILGASRGVRSRGVVHHDPSHETGRVRTRVRIEMLS